MNEIICAVISKKDNGSHTVDNMVVFDSLSAIPAVKEAFGYDFLIPVNDTVQIGDVFDADKQIFLRDGVRVYPEITDKERIDDLNTQVAQLENALCEMDETNAERMAAIEDALCEIDMGEMGGNV